MLNKHLRDIFSKFDFYMKIKRMSRVFDFTGYDPIEVFRLIYENSKPLGLGIFHFDPTPLSYAEAAKIYNEHMSSRLYVDYVKGRCIKVDFSTFPKLDLCYPIDDHGSDFPDKIFSALTRKH